MAVFSSLPLFLYLSHLPAISPFSCCLQCTEKKQFSVLFSWCARETISANCLISRFDIYATLQLKFKYTYSAMDLKKYCLYYTYSMNFKQLFIGCMSIFISEIIKVTATKFYVNVPILQCRKVLFCITTHLFSVLVKR